MFWPLRDVFEECPELRKADSLFALSRCPKQLRKKINYHLVRPASAHISEGQVCIDPDYWASCWDAAYDNSKGKNETKQAERGNIPEAPVFDTRNENHQSEDHENHWLMYNDDGDDNLVVRVGDIWPTISNITNDSHNIPSSWYSDAHLKNTVYPPALNQPMTTQMSNIRTSHYNQPPSKAQPSFNNRGRINPLKSTQLSPVDIRHLFLIPALWNGTYDAGNASGPLMMTPASNCSMANPMENLDTSCYAPVPNFDIQPPIESHSHSILTAQVPNLDDFSKSPQSLSEFNNNANIYPAHNSHYDQPASRALHLVNNCSSTEPEKQINAVDIRHLLQIPALWKKHFRTLMEQMPAKMSTTQQNEKRYNTRGNDRKTRNFTRCDSP